MTLFKSALCSFLVSWGMCVFIIQTIGIIKYKKPLNRIHIAAQGDTLGLFLVISGLMIWKGITFDSLKLLLIIVFFWIASPVSSHMLALFEMETDRNLGEMEVVRK